MSLPTLLNARSRTRNPRGIFEVDFAADASLTARTSHTATLTRATTSTGTDTSGSSITYPHSAPAWTSADWDGNGTRDRAAIALRGSDLLSYAASIRPQALTLYVAFVDRGTAAANAGVVDLGGNGSNPRLILSSVAGAFRVTHHNGTSSVTATAAATASSGDRVELRAVLQSGGNVLLGQVINGAAEVVTSTSGALTLATAWAASVLRLNRTSGSDIGSADFLRCVVYPGAITLTECRGAQP